MEAIKIFFTAANAVLPIVLTTFFGWWLRREGIMTEAFAREGSRLVFKVFLPCMMFVNVYEVAGFSSIAWDVVIYCVVVGLALFAAGVVIAVVTTKDPGRRGVLTQCSFRSNMAIIGLSLAAALGNEEAVVVATVLSAFTVAQFNMLAVLSFSVFSADGGRGREQLKALPGKILKNPLIQGILLGMACLLLRSVQRGVFGGVVFSLKEDLPFFYKVLSNLKSITTPFSLVVLGGEFTFSAVKTYRKEIMVGTLTRIVAAPLLGIGLAVVLTKLGIVYFGPSHFPAMIALFGSPAAVSSAVMASQMGGDSQLATQITVWTSLLSIITIFAISCILMAMGLI